MKNRAPTTIRIAVKEARHHLAALVQDQTQLDALEPPRVTRLECAAIAVLLDELHRLNLAVSEQRQTLQTIANRKIHGKPTRSKPAGARPPRPTTRSTSGKK